MRYLRLCRLPTVFTALADIFAGFLLSHPSLVPVNEFILLLASSATLYLSGMVFNDVFDVKQDTAERPHRPIPSGQVSQRNAVIFGSLLMGCGLTCAYFADIKSLYVAGVLAVCILLYDSIMKRTPLGPLFMGGCRFLNILLGASSSGIMLNAIWQMPQIWMAIAMGVYIVGVTWYARTEARLSNRGQLIGGLTFVNVGLLMIVLWISGLAANLGIWIGLGGFHQTWMLVFLWAAVAVTINARAIRGIRDPVPQKVKPVIGTMLLSVITLDAIAVLYKIGESGVLIAAGMMALLIPAIFLKKWISLT